MEWKIQQTTWFLLCYMIILVDTRVSPKFNLDAEAITLENTSTKSSDIGHSGHGNIHLGSHFSRHPKNAPDVTERNSDAVIPSSSDIDQVTTFYHDDIPYNSHHVISKKDSDVLTNPTTRTPIMLYRGPHRPRQPYLERPPAIKIKFSDKPKPLTSNVITKNQPDVNVAKRHEPFRAPRFVTREQNSRQTNAPYYEDNSQLQSPLVSRYTTPEMSPQLEATSWSSLRNDKSMSQLNGYDDVSAIFQEPLLTPPNDTYESRRNPPIHYRSDRHRGRTSKKNREDIIENNHFHHPRKLNYDIQSGGTYGSEEYRGNHPLNMWQHSSTQNQTVTPRIHLSSWDTEKNPHGISTKNNKFEPNFNTDNRAQFEISNNFRNPKEINEPLSEYYQNEKREGLDAYNSRLQDREHPKVGQNFEFEQPEHNRRELDDQNGKYPRDDGVLPQSHSNLPPTSQSESNRPNHIRYNNYINDNNYNDANLSSLSQHTSTGNDEVHVRSNNYSSRRQRQRAGQRSRLRIPIKSKTDHSDIPRSMHPSQINQQDFIKHHEPSFATAAAIENTYANIELKRIRPPLRSAIVSSKRYTASSQPEVSTDGYHSRRLVGNNSIVKSNRQLPFRHLNGYNEHND